MNANVGVVNPIRDDLGSNFQARSIAPRATNVAERCLQKKRAAEGRGKREE